MAFNNNFVTGEDADLWDLFRAGDEVAYNTLITKYSKTLFSYGYRISQDADFVKDCVQDVFPGALGPQVKD